MGKHHSIRNMFCLINGYRNSCPVGRVADPSCKVFFPAEPPLVLTQPRTGRATHELKMFDLRTADL